jgi:hypothetical protein
MKQRNLTCGEAVNRQLWRLESSNRRTAGKLTVTLGEGEIRKSFRSFVGKYFGKLSQWAMNTDNVISK